MKLSDYDIDSIVPFYIYDLLSKQEKNEISRFIRLPFNPRKILISTNIGLWFVGLMTPVKLEMLRSERLPEKNLLELLAFDSSRLDPFCQEMYRDREEYGLWIQYFESLTAALYNPNLSAPSARDLMEGLIRSDLRSSQEKDEISVIENLAAIIMSKRRDYVISSPVLMEIASFAEDYGFPQTAEELRDLN